jgi:FkbM family methyltransferase
MLKVCAQAALKRVGLYHRLWSSRSYDLYWRIVNRRVLDDRAKEIEFYRGVLKGLRRGALVFDVGANAGQKTDVFLRLGARVIAIEPDEQNQVVLREKFLRLRRTPMPVTVVGSAVSDRKGVEMMWIEKAGSALNTLNRKWADILRESAGRVGQQLDSGCFTQRRMVETTTLDEMIRRYGHPFYVKIDVEGHEARVLRGLLRPVPYLSCEVNLPEFLEEGVECVRLLGELSEHGEFNYAADCQRGMVLREWLDTEAFSNVLRRCEERSIEMFWRTGWPFSDESERGGNIE